MPSAGDGPASAAQTTTGDVPTLIAPTATVETLPPAPTTTPSTVATTTSTLLVARLVRVVDGDTIVVKVESGEQERVQLIGIDAPKSGRKGSKQARAYLQRLLASGPIGLNLGKDTRDKYKRLLAYLYVGPVFVNREMVAQGLAKAAPSGQNREYEQVLADAQDSAQNTFRGQWATTTTVR